MTKEIQPTHTTLEQLDMKTISIGFSFLISERNYFLEKLVLVKKFLVEKGGTVISEKETTRSTSRGNVIDYELLVNIPKKSASQHHAFDSVLNNSVEGFGAAWVTDA